MSSVLHEYEYDIFISYRQNDNKRNGWVTEFMQNLSDELEATVKDKLSIYFDENPHDGIRDTDQVEESLDKKLKSLIFIPIISKTYCDTSSFAWNNEFLAFNKIAKEDKYGLKIELLNGNTASRVLPVCIHEIDSNDQKLIESEIGRLRSVDFIYKSSGVNRPLIQSDQPENNLNKTIYRDQINKVANAIQEILDGIKAKGSQKSSGPNNEIIIPETEKKNFGNELKRRNVLRVSIAYILFAISLWKVVDVGKSLTDLPNMISQVTALVLVVFFPISIVMAWLYELSPNGLVRAESEAAKNNPFSDSQKKPFTSNTFIILLALTLGALFIIFPKFSAVDPKQIVTEEVKSIAVMAFEDMSPERDQSYFSDGVSEELINALAKLPNTRVTGRTSSFAYKGQTQNLQKIGRELGVNTILEGSVRKSGSTLRITAVLINVEDGFQIWSNTFDRELTDVFAIQDEITSAIINQLKIHLDDSDVDIRAAETDLNAYEIYLQARQKLAIRGLSLYEARDLFEKVIELDPKYSPAYSGLGRTLALIPAWYYEAEASQMNQNAKEYSEEALALNPENAEAYSVLGCVTAFYDWDFAKAEEYFERSLELNPNDTEILNFLGDFYSYTWHPKAIETEKKALELDPLHPVKYNDLSFAYAFTQNWKESESIALEGLALDTTLVSPFGNLIRAQIKLGLLDKASKLLDAYPVPNKETEIAVKQQRMWLAFTKGNLDEARLLTEELEKEALDENFNPALLAECFLLLEEYEKVGEWLQNAYEKRDYYLMASLVFTLPEDLPNNPLIQDNLNKPGLNSLYELRRRNREMRVSTK